MKYLKENGRKPGDLSPRLLVLLLQACLKTCEPYWSVLATSPIINLTDWNSSSPENDWHTNHHIFTTPREIMISPEGINKSTKVCSLVMVEHEEKRKNSVSDPHAFSKKQLLVTAKGELLWWEADYRIERNHTRQNGWDGGGVMRVDSYERTIAERSQFTLLAGDDQLLDHEIFYPGVVKTIIEALQDGLARATDNRKTKGGKRALRATRDALILVLGAIELNSEQSSALAIEVMETIIASHSEAE